MVPRSAVALIRATVVASRSVWGTASSDNCGNANQVDSSPIVLTLGIGQDQTRTLEFTACDIDGLRVSHTLPSQDDLRRFRIVVSNLRSSSWNRTLNPTYVGDGCAETIPIKRPALAYMGNVQNLFLNGRLSPCLPGLLTVLTSRGWPWNYRALIR